MTIIVNCVFGSREIHWPAVLPVPAVGDIVTIDEHDYKVDLRVLDPDPKEHEHLVGLRVTPVTLLNPPSAEGWTPHGD